MGAVMGIDLSTQSVTVEIRDDRTFDVLGRGCSPLPTTTPPVSEQHVDDWVTGLKGALRLVKEEGVDLSELRAIGIAGQCHGLVALDCKNRLIRPVKLWNDTSSADQAEALVQRFGAAYWAERTGSIPTPAWTISKLAWLLQHEPDTVVAAEKIVLPHDYLNWRLTGLFTTDRSEASGTGYFSSVRNEYDYQLLAECFGKAWEWEGVFPQVLPPDGLAGTVTEQAAHEFGLPKGIPVAAGGGDQHLAALGLGLSEGDAVFSLGTSGVVFTSSASPVFDPTGMVDGVANTVGGWLPLVSTLNSTKVTDWFAEMMGVTVKELDDLALSAPVAGCEVPLMAAYLDGERSPSHPRAEGVLSALTTGTSRAQFAAAPFYGVLMGLLRGMDAMVERGVDVSGRIIAVGGGARSDAYLQLLANLTGRDVEVIREPEATARGACVQALAVLNGTHPQEQAAKVAPVPWRSTAPQVAEALWPRMRNEYVRVCEFAADAPRINCSNERSG